MVRRRCARWRRPLKFRCDRTRRYPAVRRGARRRIRPTNASACALLQPGRWGTRAPGGYRRRHSRPPQSPRRPARVTQAADDEVVVEVRRQLAVGDQQVQQRRDVLAVELAGMLGHRRRQVQRRGDGAVVLDHGLSRFGELAVAPGLSGQVHHHTAGFHRFHRRGGDQTRRGPARDQRRGDHRRTR